MCKKFNNNKKKTLKKINKIPKKFKKKKYKKSYYKIKIMNNKVKVINKFIT